MIRYIHLKNYRSFTELYFDLASKNGIPLKFAVIYGENGSGKSNIISVFDVLYESFQSMNIRNMIMHILEENPDPENANKLAALKSYTDITRLIRQNKTVDATDNMLIEIGFYLNGKNGSYLLEFDSESIIHEKLEFTLNKNRGIYFDISKKETKINNTVFPNFRDDLLDLVKRFWGKHSAVSLLNYARGDYSKEYFESSVSSSLLDVINYFDSICIYMADNLPKRGVISGVNMLSPEMFSSGEIAASEAYKLDITEKILNSYFQSMYRDIRNVFYKRENVNESIRYDLYFTRFISGKERIVHNTNESCGTKNLIYLLPYCLSAINGQVVAIDEIDTGIHDVLLINLLKELNKDISGQVIISTHNTQLLNEYEFKDSFFFIEVNERGERSIHTPSDYGYRIQPDSNVLLNYLHNKFKGLPWDNMKLDFQYISKEMMQQASNVSNDDTI